MQKRERISVGSLFGEVGKGLILTTLRIVNLLNFSTPHFFKIQFFWRTAPGRLLGVGTFCAAVPKLSIKLSCVSADGSAKTQYLVYILDYAKSASPARVCFRPVYIITQPVGVCQELSQTFLKKLIHRISTEFPQVILFTCQEKSV